MYQCLDRSSVIPHPPRSAAATTAPPQLNIRSTPNRYSPKNTDVRITTSVVAYTSRREGQVTRFISLRTSRKNSLARGHHPNGPLRGRVARLIYRFSRHWTFLDRIFGLAGQEGLEPPAPGFGDRCSTN